MSKSAWIHIIFDNACSTLGLWLEKIGGSEIFLILIPYLGPLVHSGAARPAACPSSPSWSSLTRPAACTRRTAAAGRASPG